MSISLSSDTMSINSDPDNLVSGNQVITVSTTNSAGYEVSIATTGSSTALVHRNNSSFTIPTFSLPSGSDSIPAVSLGNGYGFSLDNGANWYPAPEPSGGNMQIGYSDTSGTHEHTLTFGVKIPENTTAGTYSDTFAIYATANVIYCPDNTTCYNGNGDDGTGIMENQVTPQSETYVTLASSNFSRPGYGFIGWNTRANGGGTSFGPNQKATNISRNLYAQWVQSSGNLQNWQGCDNMNVGDVTALTDTRDNNTYAIVKLADHNCWMTENLRLDLSNRNLTINSNNTNNPTAAFMNDVNTNHPSSSNSFCGDTNSTATESCINQILYNTNNTNRNLTASYNSNDNHSSWYSYGNYYNWYTATAGNGTYSSSSADSVTQGDLCPAGWHLPTTIDNNGDFAILNGMRRLTRKGSDHVYDRTFLLERYLESPISYVYSGQYIGNATQGRFSESLYASSNTINNVNNGIFYIGDNYAIVSGASIAKSHGLTIRCLYNRSYNSTFGTIQYNSNDGADNTISNPNVDFNTVFAASSNTFSRQNYTFSRWNTEADGSGINVFPSDSVKNIAKAKDLGAGDTLNLYAMWDPIWRFVYDGNGADAGSADSVNDQIIVNREYNSFIAPNYSRIGYSFVGWSFSQDAATKLLNHQEVTIYGPNERLYLYDEKLAPFANSENRITVYAVWLPVSTTDTMQSFDRSKCNALSTNDILVLNDTRDNNTYAISKLGDGNCWMIENLRLDPHSATLNNSNTNNPTTDFINAVSLYGSRNTLCNLDNDATCNNSAYYNTNNTNRSLTASHDSSDDHSSWYSYGNYYNWYTATAGNGTFSTTSGGIQGDICPYNWRLPTGGDNASEITILNNLINQGRTSSDQGLTKFPGNFVYSGDYNYNKGTGRGTYARVWSSVAYDASNAFRFGIAYLSVTPIRSYRKWDAFSVRCIIKP